MDRLSRMRTSPLQGFYTLPGVGSTTPYRRMIIVGATGAGKSTLAEELAGILGIPCYELDRPSDRKRSSQALQEYVQRIAGQDAWIVPADYTSVRHLLWPRAQAILWLDYPLVFSMLRLVRREFAPNIFQKALASRTRSNFWQKYRDKLQTFRRAVYIHRRNRRSLRSLLQQDEFAHVALFRFTSPSQTSAWMRAYLAGVQTATAAAKVGQGS